MSEVKKYIYIFSKAVKVGAKRRIAIHRQSLSATGGGMGIQDLTI